MPDLGASSRRPAPTIASAKPPGPARFIGKLGPLFIVLLGLSLTLAAFINLRNDALSNYESNFKARAGNLHQTVTSTVDRGIDELKGLGLFCEVYPGFNHSDFSQYVAMMTEKNISLQALEWVPRVQGKDRAEYETRARREGFPQFRILAKDPAGQLIPSPDREEYFPVFYVDPLEGNEAALGYDLGSNPARRQALENARDLGTPVVSTPIRLVQEKGSSTGFLVFVPVYEKGPAPATAQERRARLRGFALGVYRADDLTQRAVSGWETSGLAFQLDDLSAPPGDGFLSRYTPPNTTVAWDHTEPLDTYVQPLDLQTTSWQLTIVPSSSYKKAYYPYGYYLVLPAGILVTWLLALYIYILINGRFRAEQLLGDTYKRLKLATQAANIGIWDYDVVNDLLTWDDAMYMLYGVSPDHSGMAYEAWEAGLHPDDLAEGRAAIQRALNGEEDFCPEFRVVWPSDGSVHYIKANALVERDENGRPLRMIGTNWSISAQKKSEQNLRDAYAEVEQRVANRTGELAQANELLQAEIMERKLAHREINQILSSISAILIGVDRNGIVVRWNDAAVNTFALAANDAIGKSLNALPIPWEWEKIIDGVAQTQAELKPNRISIKYERRDGQDGFFVVTIGPLWNEQGGYDGFLILGDDISEVKSLAAQLAQAGKLEAIGQLAAGIAHEINTPTQYVGDSITFLKDAYADLGKVVSLCEEHLQGPGAGVEDRNQAMRDVLEEIDIDFLRGEIPNTFDRIFDGIERTSSIVQAMKRFSHSSGNDKKAVNIREAIENTLVISRNEWKYVATVETAFDPALAEVLCLPGEINQVLLNIIVNAAHAIDDV